VTGKIITMTGPSVPHRIPDPALARDGSQAAASRAPELCTRCGAVGTHYLTCPSLRLPSGYRLSADP
jgi:hypothetical protein